MVFVFHFFQAHGQDAKFFIGQTGVDLFFVLSGFLITLILLEARNERHAFTNFYVRLTLRIFPLYYGYLLLSALLGHAPAWQYWVYVQNFALSSGKAIGPPVHFWSLAVEEHFYLVWPLIALRAPRRSLPGIAAALFVISLAARVDLSRHGVDTFYPTECRLDGLALGALLALAYTAGMMRSVARYAWFVGGAAILLIFFMMIRFGGKHAEIFQNLKPTLFSVFYAAAIAVILQVQLPAVNRWLSTSFLRAIGRISYGLYVFHPALILLVLKARIPNMVLQFALALCLTFAISMLSWTFYEKRFLVLKARFTRAPGRLREQETHLV